MFKIKFNPELSFGNVLTIVIMIVSAIGAYSNLDKRLLVVETKQELTIKQTEELLASYKKLLLEAEHLILNRTLQGGHK